MCGEWGPGCVSGDTLCVVNGGLDVFWPSINTKRIGAWPCLCMMNYGT